MQISRYLILSLLFFSCSSNQYQKEDNINSIPTILNKETVPDDTALTVTNNTVQDFESVLRVGKTDWNLEEVFIDTLEFIEYNTDYDYWYAVFKNKEGKEISLYTNQEIDQFYQNRDFIVEWRLGQFFEAGEGEVIYYSEKLLSYEMLNVSSSFETFLTEFSKIYSSGKQEDLKKYIHTNQELVSTNKNGLYCIQSKSGDLPKSDYLTQAYTISSEQPKGDFCEGYPGVKDGLYYAFFDEGDDLFPVVYDLSGEIIESRLSVTEDIAFGYFGKVTVIINGYFNRNLYFFKVQTNWYFWVEDFCDCSA